MTELEIYRNYVARVAEEGPPGKVILNRNAEHAGVIIEKLFDRATREVCFLTGELNTLVYGIESVARGAIEFLRRRPQGKVIILSEKPIDMTAHPFFVGLRKANLLSRVSLFQVPKDVQSEYRYHFALADGRDLRFEKSREQFEAIVLFDDRATGEKLENAFADIKRRSTAIQLA